MYQNYNYYPQNTNPSVSQPQLSYLRQAPTQTGLKGRPVSSLEEARASSIDFDGSVFYFPDFANKRIYTKQINYDGTAILNMYELVEIKNELKEGVVLPSMEKFVTKDELQQVLADFRQSLDEKTAPAPAAKPEVMAF
jgi:hypothetical protein